MASFQARDSGVWKDSLPYARDGGIWKPVRQLYGRDGGVWKPTVTPIVEGTATSEETLTTTSHTVDLPADIESGNLLIALLDTSHTTATFTWPSGWTEFIIEAYGSGQLLGRYRTADGSEGASITVTSSLNAVSFHNVYRISAHSGTPEAAAATGSDTEPNPPSLTPSWGSDKNLWLAVASFGGATANFSADPDGYSDALESSAGSRALRSARRRVWATAEDPGVFTISSSADWAAAVIAVRPA